MSRSALVVLERMPPTAEPMVAQFWGDLADQAASLLGYHVLQQRKRRLDLRGTLDGVGARPFTPESVERYKHEVARQANPGSLFFRRAARIAVGIVSFGALLCFGPAILGWFVSWKIGLAFAGGLVACCAIAIPLDGWWPKYPGSWNVTSLIDYAEPVPHFVLRQALKIKEGFPEAEFFVHQFVQKNKVLDPLLVVRYGDEEHFIAVWDEPRPPPEPNRRVPDLERLLAQSQRSRGRKRP